MTRTIDFGLVKHLIVKMNNSNNAIMILFVSLSYCVMKSVMYPECVIASWDALILLLDAENIE